MRRGRPAAVSRRLAGAAILPSSGGERREAVEAALTPLSRCLGMTVRSVDVAGLLLGTENPSRRAQPRLAQADELVEAAAELAGPAADDIVALARDDRPRSLVSKATAVSGDFGP